MKGPATRADAGQGGRRRERQGSPAGSTAHPTSAAARRRGRRRVDGLRPWHGRERPGAHVARAAAGLVRQRADGRRLHGDRQGLLQGRGARREDPARRAVDRSGRRGGQRLGAGRQRGVHRRAGLRPQSRRAHQGLRQRVPAPSLRVLLPERDRHQDAGRFRRQDHRHPGHGPAAAKGWLYAKEHPEEAVDLVLKSASGLDREMELPTWKVSIPYVSSDATRQQGWGYMDPQVWSNLSDTYASLDQIPRKVTADEVMTNDIVLAAKTPKF